MNNTLIVVGHVGQEPHKVSFGDGGNSVVKFSVAVKEYSSNTDEDKVLWLDVDAWNGLGERVLKLVTKGRQVVLQGRLALSTFNKEVNGVKVQMTKPVMKLSEITVCGKRPDGAEDSQSEAKSSKKTRAAKG